jgi:hypothetical protein
MEIAEKFEGLRYEPGTFTHGDHLECAYAMLVKYPFMEATVRYLATIRQMAHRAGVDKKFNTTITIAFLGLIVERMEAAPHTGFDDFVERHPELLSPDILNRYYSPERLDNDLAREAFLMPDLTAR